jgi:hypothetical protein
MSDSGSAGTPSTAASAATRVGSGASRVYRAWRSLPHERRLAAYAAIGLFVSLFLPWYQRQFFAVLGGKLQPASDSQTAWGAFSFVEAAILLVAAGVLTLLFQRAEGKAFHLPFGDGGVITAAGVWSSILIIWRIFDKQGGNAHGLNATSYGIEWGIFIALAVAILLGYAGSRIRAAHRPEPPLPGEANAAGPQPPPAAGPQPLPAASPRPAAAGAAASPPAADADAEVTIKRRRPPLSSERPVGWLTARPSDPPPGPQPADQPEQPDPAATSPTEPRRPRPRPGDDATLPLDGRDR